MPTTITLKNVPDALYGRLRAAAAANRRSINSEAIVRLESALMPTTIDASEHAERARALRAELGPKMFSVREIDRAKREGRE